MLRWGYLRKSGWYITGGKQNAGGGAGGFFWPTRLCVFFVVRVICRCLTLKPWVIAGLFSRWPQLSSQVHQSLSESNVVSRHARGLQGGPVGRRLCFQCVVGVIWVYSTRTKGEKYIYDVSSLRATRECVSFMVTEQKKIDLHNKHGHSQAPDIAGTVVDPLAPTNPLHLAHNLGSCIQRCAHRLSPRVAVVLDRQTPVRQERVKPVVKVVQRCS